MNIGTCEWLIIEIKMGIKIFVININKGIVTDLKVI